MYPIKGKYSTAKIMTDEVNIDHAAYEQIIKFVNHPVFVNDPIIMPDYHAGAGCVVGFTMKMEDKIIPNIVGADIYCNMAMVYLGKLGWSIQDWLDFDAVVRSSIPMSFKHRAKPGLNIERDFPWALANTSVHVFTTRLNEKLGTSFKPGKYTVDWMLEAGEKYGCKPNTVINSLGTLGGGNHFIEFGISERTGENVATVHSGSRNFGKRMADYWQREARHFMQEKFITQRNKEILKIKCDTRPEHWEALINATKKPYVVNGLEWLEGEAMYNYLFEMHFAEFYAMKNTSMMVAKILALLDMRAEKQMDTISCAHNYLSFEDFIIRKGAVSAYEGEKMIIPFNMEDGILLCEGKGNSEWNNSAPHGAGRIGPRGKMKRDKSIDIKAIRKRMNAKGSYATVIPKDEIKEAYKDPEFIEKAIAPTAKIIDRIKPIITLKADD